MVIIIEAEEVFNMTVASTVRTECENAILIQYMGK